ncbi:MAG: hypothetical protein COA52_02205 [Hyphomicrobiales bacterium]|nr:MAG: hypothetical protein COA52_02205 [Hyphomicrobiales bacterium]
MALPSKVIPVSFFDGETARPHGFWAVIDGGLSLYNADGEVVEVDPSTLRRKPSSHGTICLVLSGSGDPRRFYIEDQNLPWGDLHWLQNIPLDKTAASPRGAISRLKIIAVAIGLVASLYLMFSHLIPSAADQLAKYIPQSFEATFGRRIENALLSAKPNAVCLSSANSASLQKIAVALAKAGDFEGPLELKLVRLPMANAIALPGGTVLITQRLMELFNSQEQLLAVLAHELGHIKQQHSLRIAVRVGASSAMAGFLFGDYAGAGAVLAVGQVLLNMSFSRDLEREADDDAIIIMQRLGIQPAVLGRVLKKMAANAVNHTEMLSTHPLTEARITAMNSASYNEILTKNYLLSAKEWTHLASVCG